MGVTDGYAGEGELGGLAQHPRGPPGFQALMLLRGECSSTQCCWLICLMLGFKTRTPMWQA